MTGAQRLGLLLPAREAAVGRLDVPSLLALARSAESAGIGSLWVGDSLFARPRLDPLTLLGALATTTNRCLLGTAVLVAPMWNPLLLARAVVGLDQLSNGRLVLGVGAGPGHGAARKEFAALGVPFENRLTRLAEIIDICQALWRGGPVDRAGPTWSFRNVEMWPHPVQPGGPPILLGGAGPRTLAAAGTRFDGWLPVVTSVAAFESGRARVQSAARAAGRDPAVVPCSAYLSLSIDNDAVRAVATLRASMEHYYGAPWAVIQSLQDSFAGPAPAAAEVVNSYLNAGAERVVLRFCGDNVLAQLEAILPYIAR